MRPALLISALVSLAIFAAGFFDDCRRLVG